MKTLSVSVSLLFTLSAVNCFAAFTFTGLNPVITENFDGLPSTTQAGLISATVGTQVDVPGTGFTATKIAGTGTTATALTADAGAGNGGGVYSYGAAASPERSLGAIASGTNIMAFGFQLVNAADSGTTITTLNFDFTMEAWRSSTTTANVLTASYGFTSGGVLSTTYLTATLTAVSPLNLNGPAAVTTNGALDGNLAANQTTTSYTLGGLNIAPGESFFLRWQDANDGGADAGLAIDNLTITIVPEPGVSMMAVCAAGAFLTRRRRQAKMGS